MFIIFIYNRLQQS